MKANNNLITDTQQDVVDILNANEQLSAIGFLIENRFDIENEIQTKLKKTGICGIVMTPTLEMAGINDKRRLVYECPDLTIQTVEYVPMNRASNKTSCMTCQDVAIVVADVLGSPKYDNWQNYQIVSIQTGEDNGLLVSKVLVRCLVTESIPAPKPVVWGTGHFEIEGWGEFTWNADMYKYEQRLGFIDEQGITLSRFPDSWSSTNFDPTKSEQVVHMEHWEHGEDIDVKVTWYE